MDTAAPLTPHDVIARVVDAAPPLSASQAATLSALLGGAR